MLEIIFKTSDGSDMSYEDLVNYLNNLLRFFPEREDWNFDELTGGRNCFFTYEAYLKTKKWHEKYRVNKMLDFK